MKKSAVSSSRVFRPSSRLNVYIEPETSITKRIATRRPPPWLDGGGGPRCLKMDDAPASPSVSRASSS
jgi:hypothetical protein